MLVEGGEIIVRCVVPVVEDAHDTFPVLVNMHGGGKYEECLRILTRDPNGLQFYLSLGWSVGSVELDDYFLRQLSVDLKLSTVNIEYRYAHDLMLRRGTHSHQPCRLAPEHPFPTAVNDCLAALKWVSTYIPPRVCLPFLIPIPHLQVVQNTELLKADLKKGFLVGGQSAGGNLAAVLAHETLADPFFAGPGRQLTGQVLREPLLIHPDAYPAE